MITGGLKGLNFTLRPSIQCGCQTTLLYAVYQMQQCTAPYIQKDGDNDEHNTLHALMIKVKVEKREINS